MQELRDLGIPMRMYGMYGRMKLLFHGDPKMPLKQSSHQKETYQVTPNPSTLLLSSFSMTKNLPNMKKWNKKTDL